ncbi:MAG: c-type cytochrome [Planctomycetia bacterium]|nr:c-type cytochrome [Planctomycetia bacterium]
MLTTVLGIALSLAVGVAAEDAEPVRSLDPRIVIERFAAEPDIVTPTGIAVDAAGRVLVVESHTHFRPPDYAGPPADRIRMLEDTDGDGRADRITTFFEGTTATMNLAVYEDGSVLVATRMEVFRLHDRDGDGRAEVRTPIAHLETAGNYPHNGLSGFAFDGLGNVYFGLGENLGADYRLVGSDGAAVTGGGEGGSIYRCSADGTGLARIATGFWNPFHLCFDAFDRLYAVDNDPDSRPPCRLLHIVPDGDYGYRYRNGRKGVHPFTAWNGELPGTLPMTAGTGEAPSGVLAYESDGLPEEYRGALLATSWGDHRIERFRLRPRGASLRAVAVPIVTGGEDFRPVGIALAPDGSLFASDWVDKSYTLHGKGRVWHIRAAGAPQRAAPGEAAAGDWRQAALASHRPTRQRAVRQLAAGAQNGHGEDAAFLADLAAGKALPQVRADALIALARVDKAGDVARRIALDDASNDMRALAVRLASDDQAAFVKMAAAGESGEVRGAALRRTRGAGAMPVLLPASSDTDPFIRQAALVGLRQSTTIDDRLRLAGSQQATVRLAALFLLREANDARARAALERLLVDDDASVRFAAIQWVAEERLSAYRGRIAASLAGGATTRNSFEACLAALERLDGVRREVKDESSGEQYVLALLRDAATPAAVRSRALRSLRPDNPELTASMLLQFAGDGAAAMRLEAVRTLRERSDPESAGILARIAEDARTPVPLRAEAIVGLVPDAPQRRSLLLDLATGEEPALRDEALRSLRGAELADDEKERLKATVAVAPDPRLVARLLDVRPAGDLPDRADRDAWLALVESPGDAAAGERIYFHPRGPACYRCHEIDGRGGAIGPDLSWTPRSLSPARLLDSLLNPSKEIAPQFTLWNVVRKDGTTFAGILLAEDADGAKRYGNVEGRAIVVAADEFASMQPQAASIMPDNLVELLTRQELRDLLAFLRKSR